MKILELCLSKSLGGLELYAKNAAKNLDATIVVLKDSKLKNSLKNDAINSYEISKFGFLKLAEFIDKNRVEILHFHHRKDILIAVLAKIFAKNKPKLVYTRHMHMTRFKSDFYHKFLYKNIDLIIAVSNETKAQLKHFIPNKICPKITLLYIGVKAPILLDEGAKFELKSKLNLNDKFIVGIIGRIEPPKGQHIVLEACEILRQKGHEISALIVGGAMSGEYLERLKNEYKNDTFISFVENPSEYMQICDVVVLATKNETFGLVLVEAMRCGVAVLGSDKGGPTEIIDDKKTGLLFKSFDALDLSKKLEILIKDESFKNLLAKNAKAKADIKFDEKKHFLELEKIFKGFIDE